MPEVEIGLDQPPCPVQPLGPRCLLSPTVGEFVLSDADVLILMGPRREGKTTGGIARILRVAATNPARQPLKAIVVRDTWMNLQRTVSESLLEGHRAGWWWVEFKEQGTEAILNGGVARFFLLGMDRPTDSDKLQGMEAAVAWIDEPAPAADLAGGVHSDVFGMLGSCLSQQGFPHSTQMTMNPPDEDHWTVLLAPRPNLSVVRFNIPPGENVHIPPEFRDKMRARFEAAGRFDLIARLVEGKLGSLTTGQAVTPEFNELIHVAKEPLIADFRFPIFRFWDFGLNPTCIWVSFYLNKYLYVLGTRMGDNVGLEQHIKSDVLPFQVKYGLGAPGPTRIGRDGSRIIEHTDEEGQPLWTPKHPGGFGKGAAAGFVYRDLGDHAGTIREQSNSESSAAWTLEAMLKTSFEPGPPEWALRRDSVRAALNRLVSGQPFIQIDPTENRPLIKALRGGWRYHKDPSGKVSDKPIKDEHSHCGDALAHGLSVLFPVHEVVRTATRAARKSQAQEPKSWVGV